MRLINEIRDDIMAAALRAAFDKCQKAHDVDTRELADAVHAHGYGAAAKIAAKLSDGWCSTSSAIHIQAPGFRYNRPEMKRDPLVMPKSSHMRWNQSSYPIKINPDHSHCGTRMSGQWQSRRRWKDGMPTCTTSRRMQTQPRHTRIKRGDALGEQLPQRDNVLKLGFSF